MDRLIEKEIKGRVVSIRDMRNTCFVDIHTPNNEKRQLIIPKNNLKINLTLGDFIYIHGSYGASKTGEPSFIVERVVHHSRYSSSAPFDISNRTTSEGYTRQARLLSEIRRLMDGEGLLEVHTPIIINNFNGGSSIPTRVIAQSELGFLRATYEDRLLKIMSDILQPVYQIGPIFKGGKEIEFLEAYIDNGEYRDINNFVGRFLRELLGVEIVFVDFIDLLKKHFTQNVVEDILTYLNHPATPQPTIENCKSKSSVGFCDKLLSVLAKKKGEWVAMSYLPKVHSPLYKEVGMRSGLDSIERSRIYKGGEVVFDIGVNDLDYTSVIKRVKELNGNTTSPYIEVLKTGLPPVSGFSARLTHLL